MIQTDSYTEKLSLWLDHELSAAEVAELQAHLSGCPVCQQTYQAMQRVHALLGLAAAEVAAPAAGFAERFETQLAQRQVAHPSYPWLGLAALSLGTVFILAVCGTMLTISVRAGANLVSVNILYLWLVDFIQSANMLGVWVSLGSSLLRACFITMNQPLFWVSAVAAAGLAWLWGRLLRLIYGRASVPVTLRLL